MNLTILHSHDKPVYRVRVVLRTIIQLVMTVVVHSCAVAFLARTLLKITFCCTQFETTCACSWVGQACSTTHALARMRVHNATKARVLQRAPGGYIPFHDGWVLTTNVVPWTTELLLVCLGPWKRIPWPVPCVGAKLQIWAYQDWQLNTQVDDAPYTCLVLKENETSRLHYSVEKTYA